MEDRIYIMKCQNSDSPFSRAVQNDGTDEEILAGAMATVRKMAVMAYLEGFDTIPLTYILYSKEGQQFYLSNTDTTLNSQAYDEIVKWGKEHDIAYGLNLISMNGLPADETTDDEAEELRKFIQEGGESKHWPGIHRYVMGEAVFKDRFGAWYWDSTEDGNLENPPEKIKLLPLSEASSHIKKLASNRDANGGLNLCDLFTKFRE